MSPVLGGGESARPLALGPGGNRCSHPTKNRNQAGIRSLVPRSLTRSFLAHLPQRLAANVKSQDTGVFARAIRSFLAHSLGTLAPSGGAFARNAPPRSSLSRDSLASLAHQESRVFARASLTTTRLAANVNGTRLNTGGAKNTSTPTPRHRAQAKNGRGSFLAKRSQRHD